MQSQKYNVEKTLRMLTLLGTHGDMAYEKFLRALNDCKFPNVVKELRRTEKTTKFGKSQKSVLILLVFSSLLCIIHNIYLDFFNSFLR